MQRGYGALGLLCTVLAGFLSACASPVPDTAPVVPQAAEEKITILFWDQFADVSEQMDAIAADFNARHDDIEVVRESYTVAAMRDIIRTALSSGTGPDIFYYDLGPGIAGLLADAGLLMPLDDAYRARGWDQRIHAWTRQYSTFQGHTYAVAHELEFIGLYYNTRLFAEHGWSIPATWTELMALCATIRAAGWIPIAFTNGPIWPSFHMFSIVMNNQVGRDRLADMIAGRESWDHPDTVEAIRKFTVEMPAAGCFPQDFAAISYEDGMAMLQTGKAAMHPSGTWNINAFSHPDLTAEPIGFFFLPVIGEQPAVIPGGIGSGWAISAATRHPEAALAFLDFLISEEMGPRWLTEINVIPAWPVDTTGLSLPTLLAMSLDTLGTQAGTMGYNIDVLMSAGFNQVQWNGFAGILAGVKTPEAVASELQAAMVDAQASGDVMDLAPSASADD